MENQERKAISSLEASIHGARDGTPGALKQILEAPVKEALIIDSLARVVEDAREDARYAAWHALLERNPDARWLSRRFGDHTDPTIAADVTSAIERAKQQEEEYVEQGIADLESMLKKENENPA